MSFLWCARSRSRVGLSPPDDKKNNSPLLKPKEGRQSSESMPPADEPSRMEFLPDPAHYELLTMIGKGCIDTATISLARHIPSGTLVSAKRVHLEICDFEFKVLQHEIRIHRVLNHPNVMEYLCCFVHKNEIWSIMPLMAYGSCRDLIHAHFTEGLPELAIAFILRDVLQGVEYIHHRGLIHRGIRASHILISATGRVCLTGFRHSHSMVNEGKRFKAMHEFPEHYENSLLWASPELLEQNLAGYDQKSDIYSLGITACELANGVIPFSDIPVTQMLLEKFDGIQPQLIDTTTMPDLAQEENMANLGTQRDSGIGDSVAPGSESRDAGPPPGYQRTFSPHFHNFVQLCLQSDPKLRPTASALLQHSFFRQVKRKSTLESLPELLQPVSPLTDVTGLPKVDSAMDEMAEQLEAVAMEDCEWEF